MRLDESMCDAALIKGDLLTHCKQLTKALKANLWNNLFTVHSQETKIYINITFSLMTVYAP